MTLPLTPRERSLAFATAALTALALVGPSVPQMAHFHAFADQRVFFGWLPHAMDVLSNLPFAIFGIAGGALLTLALRGKAIKGATLALLALFFAGLVVTAGVSSAYHWQPHDTGLAWDRAGMVLPFAGLLGLAALQAVSKRAAWALAAAVLVAGPASIYSWSQTGNVLPWGVVQFGGMALIVWFAFTKEPSVAYRLPIRWGVVMAVYAVAKVLELGDHAVWEFTGHIVSGHSLKHVVASLAAWPVISAVHTALERRQGSVDAAQCQRAQHKVAAAAH